MCVRVWCPTFVGPCGHVRFRRHATRINHPLTPYAAKRKKKVVRSRLSERAIYSVLCTYICVYMENIFDWSPSRRIDRLYIEFSTSEL